MKIPDHFVISVLPTASTEEIDNFFAPQIQNLLPEVGSRALQRLLINNGDVFSYPVEVQANNYEYSVTLDTWNPLVKILIRNYLAIEVGWE